MDSNKIKGNVASDVPVHSCRIRVGRSIDGFGLSPGITKEQRKGVEALMKKAFANLKGELQGTYYPLTAWMRKSDRSLLMITSFSCLVIEISRLLAWRETGLRVVVSSTMLTKPSLHGSMRK